MGKFDTIIGYVVIYKEAALGKKYKWCTFYLVNPYKIPLFIKARTLDLLFCMLSGGKGELHGNSCSF